MSDQDKTTPPCEDCGEPSTHLTVDGVPLCERDWLRLLDQAANMEGCDA